MEATSYFRFERGGQSFGGSSQGFEGRQHQKRHKFHGMTPNAQYAVLSRADRSPSIELLRQDDAVNA